VLWRLRQAQHTATHTATHISTYCNTHCNTQQMTSVMTPLMKCWHTVAECVVITLKLGHLTIENSHRATPIVNYKSWHLNREMLWLLRTYISRFTCYHWHFTIEKNHRADFCETSELMGWLRWVGAFKLYVSFAEYSLFYGALLQKNHRADFCETSKLMGWLRWVGAFKL